MRLIKEDFHPLTFDIRDALCVQSVERRLIEARHVAG